MLPLSLAFTQVALDELKKEDWGFLEQEMTGAQVEQLEELRLCAFKLQAFGRLMRRGYKKNLSLKQVSVDLKDAAKFIEDSIGNLLYIWEMHSELNEDKPAFNSSRHKLREEHLIFLSALKVFPEHLKKIENALIELTTREIDLRRRYLKGLVRELKRLNQGVSLLDPNLLEDGTHDLRRKLRWILMYLSYPNGLFGYKLTSKNVIFDKYTSLSPRNECSPVLVSPNPVVKLSGMIASLGKAKDRGLVSVYIKSLESEVSDHNVSSAKIVNQTKEIITEVASENYINILRDEVKPYI